MATLPFDVSIWDKDFNYLGACNDPETLVVTPAHLALGTATLTVSMFHPKTSLLGAPGNRLLFKYLGEPVMSGPILAMAGQRSDNTLSYTVTSDESIFWSTLGYPVPGSALTAQGTGTDDKSGPAETVLKHYISENATRLGLPVTVAPDLGRGSTISASIRMQLLSDALLTDLQTSGIGFRCIQGDGGLVFDVYETQTYPQVLTELSGIVQDWSWSTQAATATRTVVGGAAVGTSQQYALVTDSATESSYGMVIESYTDDSSETDPANLPAAGQTALTAAASTSGLSVTLSDTKSFQYGTSVNVGDTVTIQYGPGLTITDVLAQATLNWDRDTGFTATPVIGEHSNDPTVTLVKKLVQLGQVVRKRFTS